MLLGGVLHTSQFMPVAHRPKLQVAKPPSTHSQLAGYAHASQVDSRSTFTANRAHGSVVPLSAVTAPSFPETPASSFGLAEPCMQAWPPIAAAQTSRPKTHEARGIAR